MPLNSYQQCFFIKPYSDSIGRVFDIIYFPGYGVTAPYLCTTNGNPHVIAEFIDSSNVLELFDEWLTFLGYKYHLTEKYKLEIKEHRKRFKNSCTN